MEAKTLAMHQISKDFPSVRALDHVDFQVSSGEIHGVVGANGAGKSTLVKILSGQFRKYSGSIEIDGRAVRVGSPRTAQAWGISVLQQEPDLAWNLSVCQNIMLAGARSPSQRFGLLNRKAMREECVRLLTEQGVDISPDRLAGTLDRRELQLVQIARVLASHSKVLVLDEPTTALTEQDRENLLVRIRASAHQGVALILISHRIEDVFEVCQRISVLRDGRKVLDADIRDTAHASILREMFGEAAPVKRTRRTEFGPNALELRRVGTARVPQISLTVREGEIVGLTGRPGAAVELLRATYGAATRKCGRVIVGVQEPSISNPRDAIRAGVGLLPEDRARDGLFPSMSVLANIAVLVLRNFVRYGRLQWARTRELVDRQVQELGIRVRTVDQTVGVLSGGNQQKSLFARWLCANPRVFLLEAPTSGMDIRAKQDILRITQDLTDHGAAVLMASNDVDELIHLCDRIIVLRGDRESLSIEVDDNTPLPLIAMMADAWSPG